MAAVAGRDYGEVYVGGIEQALDELLPDIDGRYDTVLLLDVLEHLVDPWAVLGRCRRLLSEDGRALLSIPNVAHWSVRRDLLRGRWRYQESGLLDRTHLRFFTRATARGLIAESGWAAAWESVSVGQPPLVRLPPRYLRVLEISPSFFGVQFLFEARPARTCKEAAIQDSTHESGASG
jgi:SAM-dependent methyltransferase